MRPGAVGTGSGQEVGLALCTPSLRPSQTDARPQASGTERINFRCVIHRVVVICHSGPTTLSQVRTSAHRAHLQTRKPSSW